MEQRLQTLEKTNETKLNNFDNTLRNSMNQSREESSTQFRAFRKTVDESVKTGYDNLGERFIQLQQSVSAQIRQMEQRVETLEKTNETKLTNMETSFRENMTMMRKENNQKLEEIRGTVDEKLQTALEKRLTESFKTVSAQLEQVYTGLGEMKTLAQDVGGLKKVLTGVKTRGILGEIQLGAILEEILSPEQYETNVAVNPRKPERVEYAIRLPGNNGGTVYLPIDSKFPGERYQQLLDARDQSDREKEKEAMRNLETVLVSEAKDIRDKYIDVPHTTNFAIMFLPFEGLYAEAVNQGIIERFQREYHVNVAGPSTMAALLNSLQMGFRTLAIQKRSNEVWEVLAAVKTEFEKFEELLGNMQKHLNQTSSDLDKLMGTRTRAITRSLRKVQALDENTSGTLLELDAGEE